MRKPREKPSYSFIVLSYNHAGYVRLALDSVYLQDGMKDCQIIVHDDASVDLSKSIIEQWASSHLPQVTTLFSKRNAGTASALSKAALLADGMYLIITASDDISNRCRSMVINEAIEACENKVYGGFSDVTAIDQYGVIIDKDDPPNFPHLNLDAESIAKEFTGFLGASSFYHRDVIARYGPLPDGLLHEDMIFNFRAALLGATIFLPQKLVRYRQHRLNVHYFDGNKNPRSRLAHAIKIGKSLSKVAEQRCVDLAVARKWIPAKRADMLWSYCKYWRSTHRIKVAVLASRMSMRKACIIAFTRNVSFKEIAKAAILRTIIVTKDAFYKLGLKTCSLSAPWA